MIISKKKLFSSEIVFSNFFFRVTDYIIVTEIKHFRGPLLGYPIMPWLRNLYGDQETSWEGGGKRPHEAAYNWLPQKPPLNHKHGTERLKGVLNLAPEKPRHVNLSDCRWWKEVWASVYRVKFLILVISTQIGLYSPFFRLIWKPTMFRLVPNQSKKW